MAPLIPPPGNATITNYFKRSAGPVEVASKRVKASETRDQHVDLRIEPVATENKDVFIDDTRGMNSEENLADTHAEHFGAEEATTSMSSVVATPRPQTASIMPFQNQDIYICPFKAAKRKCPHSTGRFSNARSRNKHVNTIHSSDAPTTSFDDSSFEDGNIKIPCPKGCESRFMSYSEAVKHGKSCQAPRKESYPCPWRPYNNCTRECIDLKALANHTRGHIGDAHNPYHCFKGCGELHADLYILSAHESKCDGTGPLMRETAFVAGRLGSHEPKLS